MSVSPSAMPARLPRAPAVSTKTLAGIGLLIAAVACFAVLDTTTKRVTLEVPLLMAIWARNFFQALLTTALVIPKKGMSVFRTDNLGMQVARGLLITMVTLLAFASLRVMPVGEFTAIVMTTPLLVTLLAARLLGEHVSIFRVVLVTGGFIGTAIIVRPGGDAVSWNSWAMLLPLGLVIANAAFQLLTSKLTRTESTLTTQFYTSWVSLLVTSVPLYWAWTTLSDVHLWLGLALMGVAGSVGHLLMIMAFERSPAATLMPYMYMQIGFAMLGGWIMFDHIPDHMSLIGIGLIALCGTAGGLLTLHEARLRRL
ncbi:DMT family transporter [Rhodoferax sp. GW822-FHT02A01]|uniref:DMT family transporter n=1 Tax=Rhodoferax sp. GW822-FHT02A01 TaxID=3141537 RepID=UPI00315D580B